MWGFHDDDYSGSSNSQSLDRIISEEFYFIGTKQGIAIDNHKFSNSDKAEKHYKKAMQKRNYPVFVCKSSVVAVKQIII